MKTKETTSDTAPLAQRITQGPAHQFRRDITGKHGFPICRVSNEEIPDGEMQANAALIMEAFTVCHETGRTPRQLADERTELIVTVQSLLATGSFARNGDPADSTARNAAELLTRLQSPPQSEEEDEDVNGYSGPTAADYASWAEDRADDLERLRPNY